MASKKKKANKTASPKEFKNELEKMEADQGWSADTILEMMEEFIVNSNGKIGVDFLRHARALQRTERAATKEGVSLD